MPFLVFTQPPKERGEGHDIRRKPPLSFGEGPGVRSLRDDIFNCYILFIRHYLMTLEGRGEFKSKKISSKLLIKIVANKNLLNVAIIH
jgi:hypothetical protein